MTEQYFITYSGVKTAREVITARYCQEAGGYYSPVLVYLYFYCPIEAIEDFNTWLRSEVLQVAGTNILHKEYI